VCRNDDENFISEVNLNAHRLGVRSRSACYPPKDFLCASRSCRSDTLYRS
jgi:hypothetical protein